MHATIDAARGSFWRIRDSLRDRLQESHRRDVFSRIHVNNSWGDQESVSGRGSGTLATEAIREQLPEIFTRYRVRSLLDAPCGDFHWMRHVAGRLDRYIGVDIVPNLIEQNIRAYGTTTISFLCADIAADWLPSADLVLCRDCLIHLPTRLIKQAVNNFRATGSKYLLLSNDREVVSYHDIAIGSFRPINFRRPPFSFPEPLDVVRESGSGSRQLCLWDLQSLVS
jgi:hypothetical protein